MGEIDVIVFDEREWIDSNFRFIGWKEDALF